MSMSAGNQPRAQLARAKSSIDSMKNSRSLEEFEEHWKSFLHSLERVWSKALHKYAKENGWQKLKVKSEQVRKEDPLLAYLRNARGADEHTIHEIVSREPGGIGINAAEGNSLFIEHMEVSRDKILIKSPQKIRVDFIPGKTKLLPIVDRGQTYPVPTSHLGESVDPTNVIEVAEKAAKFYEGVLDKMDASIGE
jgi:hypothetical protein